MWPKVLLVSYGIIAALNANTLDKSWFPIQNDQRVNFDGFWGDWGPKQYCRQSIATGFKVRTEGQQGRGDDTALNSICLKCASGEQICSRQGFWGDWHSSSTCNKGFSRADLRIEGHQGRGDDTAGNTLRLKCGSGWRYANNAPDMWGDWWEEKGCKYGTKICGLKTRVEGRQGGGDDTALNGVEFFCCAKVSKVEVFLKPIIEAAGGSGNKSSYRRKIKVSVGLKSSSTIQRTTAVNVASELSASGLIKAVNFGGKISSSFARSTFSSVFRQTSMNRTEEREYTIFFDKPTYVYQARSTIVLTDGSEISQGSHVIQRSKPITTSSFIVYKSA